VHKQTTDVKELERIANDVRKWSIKMTTAANSGHPGGSLSSADFFTALYFSVMKHDPAKPDWDGRDRFILSNGHICPAWYSVQALAGYFPVEELMTFRQFGSRLQGHPTRGTLPTIEISTGSLGQGFSAAVGYALGLQLAGKPNKVFVSVGDGELEEGATWEAAMAGSHYKLGNLIAVCDRNGLQQNGSTEDLIGLEPLAGKYTAFGWRVVEAEGNDMAKVLDAFKKALAPSQKPTMILFKTVMGKGVKFMENDHQWHGKALPQDKAEAALKELG
jgi:transketolase